MAQTFNAQTFNARTFRQRSWANTDGVLEYALLSSLFHFELPSSRMHFVIPGGGTMPSDKTARQICNKTETEVRRARVNFSGDLVDGELLTGNPTVTVTPSGLTISEEDVNSGALTVIRTVIPAGEVATFLVTGGEAGTQYTAMVEADTDDGQTLVGYVRIDVVED